MSAPWEADRVLTLALARAAITACVPSIDTTDIRYVGSGWDFDVYATRDGWAFRFPRRAECAHNLDRERRLVDLASKVLPRTIAVPRLEFVGDPSSAFPYRFTAHRFIDGVTAEALDPALVSNLAADIGAALGAIHAIPLSEARDAGLAEAELDDIGRQAWFDHGVKATRELRGSHPLVDRALEWASRFQWPDLRYDGPLRLIHQDLGTDHLIVDAATGRLTGIIDWSDAMLGDPARDFVFAVAWRGWDFAEDVLRAYPHSVDAGFRDRLSSMSRLLTLVWLGIAHEQRSNVAKQLEWLGNAFQGDL